MMIEEMENRKRPRGIVSLIGLGRLGLRTALHLLQVHRGGPEKIILIDGQKISDEDFFFKLLGGRPGEYKVDYIKELAGASCGCEISAIPENITGENLHLVCGDVVCIEIAGGDTLPVTASIIMRAHEIGSSTISTMGVFGIGEEPIYSTDIMQADKENPIVSTLISYGIRNHWLIGTGKLIRDWEPVTPYVMDRISQIMTTEILKKLQIYDDTNRNS